MLVKGTQGHQQHGYWLWVCVRAYHEIDVFTGTYHWLKVSDTNIRRAVRSHHLFWMTSSHQNYFRMSASQIMFEVDIFGIVINSVPVEGLAPLNAQTYPVLVPCINGTRTLCKCSVRVSKYTPTYKSCPSYPIHINRRHMNTTYTICMFVTMHGMQKWYVTHPLVVEIWRKKEERQMTCHSTSAPKYKLLHIFMLHGLHGWYRWYRTHEQNHTKAKQNNIFDILSQMFRSWFKRKYEYKPHKWK